MELIFRPLLWFFSILYGAIIRFRNHLYDIGYAKSIDFEVPVVVVGNLRVGGSGKTPFTEYLIDRLAKDYQLCVLSRGYRRKTFGFKLAGEEDTPQSIGDESFQIYQKYHQKIAVAVGEERAVAIPQILMEKPECNLILMDDGFQHRAVTPSMGIVLSDYHHDLLSDRMLPLGRLREPIQALNRAHALVITKCPVDMSVEKRTALKNQILEKGGAKMPIFFASYRLSESVIWIGENQTSNKFFFVTAIANPEQALRDFSEKVNVLGHKFYGDHYHFRDTDLSSWLKSCPELESGEASLLCTEKDLAKIQILLQAERWSSLRLAYFSMEMFFLQEEKEFEQLLFSRLSSHGLSEND